MDLIFALLGLMIPFCFSATGELIIEKSGILNLGIEGNMVWGAFIGWYITVLSNSSIVGLFFAILLGVLLGIIFWFMVDILEIAQHIVGLSFTFILYGISYTFFRMLPQETRLIIIHNNPITNYILISFLLIFCLLLLLYQIKFKEHKMSITWLLTGYNLRSSDLLGINIRLTRLISSCLGISFTTVSGAIISIYIINNFTIGLISGKGWITLCLVILARWKPLWLIPSILLWGILEVMQFYVQSRGIQIPFQLLLMFPYLFGFILISIVGTGKLAPKMLLKIYKRREDAA